ncbi:MAG: UPF0175 family protein [Pyrinomonadaceae bacterium]|jgi:predicted HTH domain antitoxin|nr:UPF0175 family protein [Pyrinomonadaceae bacterium]
MNIEVTIPDEIFEESQPKLSRYILEQIAIKGYKSGTLSMVQVRKLLAFSSRMETEDFLRSREALVYTVEDYQEDLKTLGDLGLR